MTRRDASRVRLFTAMVTPFTATGALDVGQAARLADWLGRHGTEGLVLAGTTGEGPTLSLDERHALLDHVRQAVPDLPTFLGTGHNSTATTVEWTQLAEAWGADGVMVVTPYYNKPPQSGLYAHFHAVAASTALPVMLYDVPGRTGVHLHPDTTLALMVDHPNIWAIKEASGSVEDLAVLARNAPVGHRVFTGEDHLLLSALEVGAYGVVSVASHVAGPELATLIQATLAGRAEEASALAQRIAPVISELFAVTNPIPVKWALNHLGLAVGPTRLPLLPGADEDMTRLAAALQAAGLARGAIPPV